jgi:hypothetical protein
MRGLIDGDDSPCIPADHALSTVGLPNPPALARRLPLRQLLPLSRRRSAQTRPEDRPLCTRWLRPPTAPAGRWPHRATPQPGLCLQPLSSLPRHFAGQGAWINLAGEKGAMVVAAPCWTIFTLSTNVFLNFPVHCWVLLPTCARSTMTRLTIADARERYQAHPAGVKRPDYDGRSKGARIAAHSVAGLQRRGVGPHGAPGADLKQPACLNGAPRLTRSRVCCAVTAFLCW